MKSSPKSTIRANDHLAPATAEQHGATEESDLKIERHEKLVRDKIPELLARNRIGHVTRRVRGDEYRNALIAKLREETEEFCASRDDGEIGDILDVIDSIIREMGFSRSQIDDRRTIKTRERGGFNDGVFLVETEE